MSQIKQYIKCFAEMFSLPEDEVKRLSYQSIKEWDSVGHMNLMGVIEEEFEIEMEIDDITDFSSFEKGKTILLKYGINIDG